LSLRSSTALASTPRAVAPTTKAASPSDRTHARMPHDSARSRPAATARVARPFLSTASGLRARVQILCLVFQVPSGLLLSRCSPLFRTSAAPSRGATASAHVGGAVSQRLPDWPEAEQYPRTVSMVQRAYITNER